MIPDTESLSLWCCCRLPDSDLVRWIRDSPPVPSNLLPGILLGRLVSPRKLSDAGEREGERLSAISEESMVLAECIAKR